jgi:hypothetical protein
MSEDEIIVRGSLWFWSGGTSKWEKLLGSSICSGQGQRNTSENVILELNSEREILYDLL